jgi:type VI secretion system secreted protein VgrG
MTTYLRTARPLRLDTPLGPDALLLTSFSGTEAISQLYSFHLEMLAPNSRVIPFDQLVGQAFTVTLALPGRQDRHFSGICSRLGEGHRGDSTTMYEAEVVPAFWLLTRRLQSRIFQNKSVPDVLRDVLGDLDVTFALLGDYEARDYCVQYRESDFDFASRVMEEEGIFYFFSHDPDGHRMIIGDSPQSHPALPDQTTIPFNRTPARTAGSLWVSDWLKTQELRSGKVTLRDHHFQLPQQSLEVEATIQESAQAGQVTHELRLAGNEQLEVYDYPGEYAQRFDGVDPGGGDRPGELAKILPDGRRTAGIRMQEEAAGSLGIEGASTASNFVGGFRFALDGHFDGNGPYVLTSVSHTVTVPDPDTRHVSYSNRFTCIPLALPFRPPRTTPKAVVRGLQTAYVVGPEGAETFTDKYGRVKVQFHWDREGGNDENSSCWLRVSQLPTSGALFIPRIGWEVVVGFLDGDPDQPIVLGRVYNAEQPPPAPPQ